MRISSTFMTIIGIIVCLSCNNPNSGLPSDPDLNYQELITKTPAQQGSIIAKLNPKTRVALWIRKIDDTLASEQLNDREKNLIRPLRSMISQEVFIEGSPENELFNAFCPILEDLLIKEMGWDEKKLFKYLETVMTEEEISNCDYIH